MSKLIIYPASRGPAVEHYADTMSEPIDFTKYKSIISTAAYQKLLRSFPNGKAQFWGTRPGKLTSLYNDLNIDDVALFYRTGKFISRGTIEVKLHEPVFAETLWGKDENGRSWELMVAITDVEERDLPADPLKTLFGYSPDWYYPGTMLVPEELTEEAIEQFNLETPHGSSTAGTGPSASATIPPTTAITDGRAEQIIRKEQRKLRAFLLQGRAEAECAFCGEIRPATMLRAAHIKKRSDATTAERNDFNHIALLACVIGCDAFFEEGFISVSTDGTIISGGGSYLDDFPQLKNQIQKLDGRPAGVDMSGREDYFEWHRRMRFRAPNDAS